MSYIHFVYIAGSNDQDDDVEEEEEEDEEYSLAEVIFY